MIEKIFGKKKSIQRKLIIDLIVAIVVVMLVFSITFKFFIDNEALNKMVQINVNTEEEIKEIRTIIKRGFWLLILNTIIIGGSVMGITAKKMLRPIQKITEATKKVAAGDFTVKLETQRQDEVGELTTNFNKMVKDLGSIECLQKEFIDNVSHEIKTPISSIQGFAKLLEDEELSIEERKEYCEIIQEESNRLLNISTNILKLSKLQNQNKITNKEQIDVAEQIRKTISLLETKWRTKEISFSVSLQEKYFYGDEDLTFQIWINLIDNAIKFSNDKGKIEVDLIEKDDFIEVKIKDYGIGINNEEKDKIFTRFYQIDKSHSEKGSGLGLAIVKRIVELSEGSIEVQSEENLGTTIIVKLPIEKETNKILI